MTRTNTSRPRMTAIYAPGAVRARRWHGDVRGYRPPSAGQPAPTSPTFTPSRAAPCRVPCGGLSKRRNNHDQPRAHAVPTWARGRRKIRARQWPRPDSRLKARTPLRRLRAGGEGAAHKRPCAREAPEAHQCVGAKRRRHCERAPPQWAGLVGLRPGLLRQVARKRAVLDAGGSSPVRHEGRLTDAPPGLAMELPHHASNTRPPAAAGALSPCRRVLSLPVSERKPVKPSRGDAESAMSPFGSGRPVRPCVVVNPGGGTAAPWASWPQPSSENNFPCAARIPRGTNSFRFQVLHCVSTASGAARPSPAGRFTTRTQWRDLVQPERRNHHG